MTVRTTAAAARLLLRWVRAVPVVRVLLVRIGTVVVRMSVVMLVPGRRGWVVHIEGDGLFVGILQSGRAPTLGLPRRLCYG